MNKGDYIYYARIIPQTGLFEVVDLTIRTVADDWYVGCDTITKRSFLFGEKDIDVTFFYKRCDAVEKVTAAQTKYGNIKLTKISIDETEEL